MEVWEQYFSRLNIEKIFRVNDQCLRVDEATVVLTFEEGVKIAFESLL